MQGHAGPTQELDLGKPKAWIATSLDKTGYKQGKQIKQKLDTNKIRDSRQSSERWSLLVGLRWTSSTTQPGHG